MHHGKSSLFLSMSLIILSFTLGLNGCVPSHLVTSTPSLYSPSTPPTFSLSPSPDANNSHVLRINPLEKTEIDQYDLLELEIQTAIVVTNPYDPDELDLRVRFISPSGKENDIGAFWFQDYDLKNRNQIGAAGWRARFTPTEIGTWTVMAHIAAKSLASNAVTFLVKPSDNPGFVRINPDNPRYFAFDNGDFFFPIGMNIGWWCGTCDPLDKYRELMDLFHAKGGNTIRVWMAEWSFGIEWNDTPLGNYEKRLQRAWLLDQIFTMAEERDIYVVLVLLNCADFNNWQTNGWNGNPYNAARGGPLEKPEQFVTDPTARVLLQRRLNYIINRWGYSPHLLAWEWWNEVNLAPFSDETLIPWLQEMSSYLQQRDVNQHLTTNSYAIRDQSPIWEMPELDIVMKHEYTNQISSAYRDLGDRALADFQKLTASFPAKPVLLGEFGYSTDFNEEISERTGIHLHNGIWATTFSGYAGSGMYWNWDTVIEQYNLWYHYRGLSRFLEGVNLTTYQPISTLTISGTGGEPGQAIVMGLRGEDILIWLRSNEYTTATVIASNGRKPPMMENYMLTLRDVAEGEYTVKWFDPQIAKWLDETIVHTGTENLEIPVPAFYRDLAAKIIRNP